MTQRHYLDSIKDDQSLCPQFKSLLRHHWMEEAQHARLDTLMVEALAASMSQAEIEKAIGEYLEIGGFIDGGLRQQVEFDLDSFTRATGRTLSESERERATEAQVRANRYTYLVSGMTHPNFLATIESIHPAGRARIEEVAAALS
jgi:primosomal replication protein N